MKCLFETMGRKNFPLFLARLQNGVGQAWRRICQNLTMIVVRDRITNKSYWWRKKTENFGSLKSIASNSEHVLNSHSKLLPIQKSVGYSTQPVGSLEIHNHPPYSRIITLSHDGKAMRQCLFKVPKTSAAISEAIKTWHRSIHADMLSFREYRFWMVKHNWG